MATTVVYGDLSIAVPEVQERMIAGEVQMVPLTDEDVRNYEAQAFEQAARQAFGISFREYRERLNPKPVTPEGGEG